MGAINPSENSQRKVYYKIVNEENPFRVKVKEGTAGAIKRTFTNMKNETFIMWEFQYKGLKGYLKSIDKEIKEFKSGKVSVAVITLRDENPAEPDMVLQLSLSNDAIAANNLIEKLCSIDINQEVLITYYNFEDKTTGKKKKGFTVRQGDYDDDSSRVYSKFYDPDRGSINGIPTIAKEQRANMDSDDWKSHWKDISKFLFTYFDNVVKPTISDLDNENPKQDVYAAQETSTEDFEENTEEPTQAGETAGPGEYEDDLPF